MLFFYSLIGSSFLLPFLVSHSISHTCIHVVYRLLLLPTCHFFVCLIRSHQWIYRLVIKILTQGVPRRLSSQNCSLFYFQNSFPYVCRRFSGFCFTSKKSALLCCIFLTGVKCRRNSVYSLCNGSELGSLSLSVFVISVIAVCPSAQRNMSFISDPNWSRYCGSISLLLVVVDRSMSYVISIYWTNFRHRKFALVWSFFSNVGMVSFCVQIGSAALFIVSLVSRCPLACDTADVDAFPPFLGVFSGSSSYDFFCFIICVLV